MHHKNNLESVVIILEYLQATAIATSGLVTIFVTNTTRTKMSPGKKIEMIFKYNFIHTSLNEFKTNR